MRKNSRLAGFLIFPLGVAEFAESGENPRLVAMRSPAIHSSSANSLTSNLHTHYDLETPEYGMTAAAFSASGSRQSEDQFQLFIVPQPSGISLVANPIGNYRVVADSRPLSSLREPEFEFESQRMYGSYGSVDELIDLLASRLELPQVQLSAIRRNALEGRAQAIGGYTANRFFDRGELKDLRMNFRPPDC